MMRIFLVRVFGTLSDMHSNESIPESSETDPKDPFEVPACFLAFLPSISAFLRLCAANRTGFSLSPVW